MVRPTFDARAAGFVGTMRAVVEAGVLLLVHCEDAAIVADTAATFVAEGRAGLENFADARPVEAEEAATRRAIAMAEVTGAPIYIVHLSSERALRAAEEARERGLPVYVETRPIYLHLTRERFEGPTPGLYIGQPPLRTQRDQDAMWEGIARGAIDVVASDHVAYTRELKLDPAQTVASHRAGMSNLQVMLPMIHSDGVRTGRITLERFVAVTSTNAAKLFGLYPRKGDHRRRLRRRPRALGSRRDTRDPRRRHALQQRLLRVRGPRGHRLAGPHDPPRRGRLPRRRDSRRARERRAAGAGDPGSARSCRGCHGPRATADSGSRATSPPVVPRRTAAGLATRHGGGNQPARFVDDARAGYRGLAGSAVKTALLLRLFSEAPRSESRRRVSGGHYRRVLPVPAGCDIGRPDP